MREHSIAIIGLGALGTMYAARFFDKAGAAAVQVVADNARVEKYKEQGIYYNGRKYNFDYASCGQDDPAELVIFSVKYQALEKAIKQAEPFVGEDTVIISVLNGVTSEEKLTEVFGSRVLLCTAQGMDAVKTGNRAAAEKMGYLCFGSKNGAMNRSVKTAARLFDEAQIKYELADDMPRRLWSKLLLNTGINQACMAFAANYGGVQRKGEARDVMLGAMLEVIAVAQKYGVELTMEDYNMWLGVIDELNPAGMPSMRQDALAQRHTEVELFSGTIKKLGGQLDVPTPINDLLYKIIKSLEDGYPD